MKNDINKLSSKEDWEKHWKEFQPATVKYIRLDDLINDLPKQAEFIEVGGFPGIYSIYFNQKLGYKTTLLDFVINKEIINKVETANGLPENSIEVIEGDFFNIEVQKKFDVVFSWGFIEHFNDVQDVVNRHVMLLKEGGHLLMGIPNLKGLSGRFLKSTDNTCYKIHNVDCMDIDYLIEVCRNLNLKEIKVFYYGNPKVWLNSTSKYDNRFMRFFTWTINSILKRIKLKSKFFSPHIIIKAVR